MGDLVIRQHSVFHQSFVVKPGLFCAGCNNSVYVVVASKRLFCKHCWDYLEANTFFEVKCELCGGMMSKYNLGGYVCLKCKNKKK